MKRNISENMPLPSWLTQEERKELVLRSKRRRYPSGSVVFHQGDDSEASYLILKGKVKVVLISGSGREIALNILKSGSYFGETSVFGGMPRSVTVIALEDSELLVIPRLVILDMLEKNPRIAVEALPDVITKLRGMEQLINDLVFLNVRHRVAKTLLAFSCETPVEVTDGYRVFPRPPMKDIAAMSGTSRETVSRVLSDFCKKKYLKLTRENIIIYKSLAIDEDLI